MVKVGTLIPRMYTPGARDPWYKMNEEARLMEDMGFDFTTVGQHSFTPDFPYPTPLTTLAWLAARTTRLRLVTGIVILPLYSPVAIAEQVAELAELSGGRIVLGVGTGYRKYEFDAYGIDMKTRGKRMDEAVQLLQQVFQTGEFDFSGEFYRVPKALLCPKPDVPPPIWIGGTSAAALRRAARWADGVLTENMSTLKVMSAHIARYRALAREAGRQPGSVVLYRNAYLSTSRSDIEENFIPSALKEHLGYRSHGAAENVEDENRFYARAALGEKISLEEMTNGRFIAGNPEQVIQQIKAWEQATGMTHLNLMGIGPQRTDEERRKTLELWGREVIPYI
ncbi:MAG: LLM class flavin-dependent oxidoreductase [Steroidobacteraceae bacterium]